MTKSRILWFLVGSWTSNIFHKEEVQNNVNSSYSSSFPLEHRALTTSFHLSLSLAALFASSQVMLMVFNSACSVLFHAKLGPPLLHFPCGFQCKAWRVMFVYSRHMVCPIHPHFLLWMVSVVGSYLVLCQRSWLETSSGHQMRRIWQRQVLMKTCSLWSNFLVHLQVCAPYKRTDLTLLLNSLSFVWQLRFYSSILVSEWQRLDALCWS